MADIATPLSGIQDSSSTIWAWRQEGWLAPRLVLVTLLAIVLSLLGERANIPETALLSLNIISYAAGGFFRRQDSNGELTTGRN